MNLTTTRLAPGLYEVKGWKAVIEKRDELDGYWYVVTTEVGGGSDCDEGSRTKREALARLGRTLARQDEALTGEWARHRIARADEGDR